MVVVNWERGARGPRYATAAANTQLVGRQLALLLLDMARLGMPLARAHLVGFSLGAHAAAVAGHALAGRVGRITALDPAGPLFDARRLRDEPARRLDPLDAHLVHVIHTDGSPTPTEGFGLWPPVGHADFYVNGGRAQPGCRDRPAAVVASQLGEQQYCGTGFPPRQRSLNDAYTHARLVRPTIGMKNRLDRSTQDDTLLR